MRIAVRRLAVLPLVSLMLCACGGAEEKAPEPPPVEDTVFGDMVGTMDEARTVETTTMEHKNELDHAMQQAEGAQ